MSYYCEKKVLDNFNDLTSIIRDIFNIVIFLRM